MSYPQNIIKDYNFVPPLRRAPLPFRLRWAALLVGCIIIGVVAANNEAVSIKPRAERVADDEWVEIPLPGAPISLAPETAASSAAQAPAVTLAVAIALPEPATSHPADELLPAATAQEQTPEPEQPGFEHTVGNGDTLSGIFARAGFPNADLVALTRVKKAPWRSLRPGQRMVFYANAAGELDKLILHQDETRQVIFKRDGQQFTWHEHDTPTEVRQAYAHGVIQDSLFVAGRRAGMADGLTMDLAYIFGWDIDFALDVRRGDRFTVIYEKIFQNGQFLRVGDILAAEFINRGRVYRAVRYTPASGRSDYYTPEGHSMRKAFLRSPLNFARISSRFSRGRLHPVLNRIRAHKGVDYAAPRGTPVWSTGDGKVSFRANKGGYGKTVIVNHGTRYSTLYAHLRGYAKGIRNGKRVKQGQVIGYVGTTGLSTGPHLHYEFRVNGTHRDPLRVKLPQAKPLPAREMTAFKAHSVPFWAQIDVLERTQVALTDQEY